MRRAGFVLPDLLCHLQQLMQQIPAGRVTTAGTLAAALGNPVAARWVGHVLLHHEHHDGCLCHRVVRAGGLLGGYVAGTESAKTAVLCREGVKVEGGIIDLERFGFQDFRGERPLDALTRLQEEIVARTKVRRYRHMPRLVGGVDVSYIPTGVPPRLCPVLSSVATDPPPPATIGIAAYALVDSASGELVWSAVIERPVRFPYISSYLTFRELPLLLDLLDEVRRAGRLAPVVLVDGTGVLHPRQAGIATHLGVVASLPTVGVTKRLLCGRVDLDGMRPLESRPVVYNDNLLGVGLRPTAGSRRPLFISIGHLVDLPFAEQVVRTVLAGRRLPAPLYWSDRLSRQVAKLDQLGQVPRARHATEVRHGVPDLREKPPGRIDADA
jgi:deoxyribonuclease V